MFNDGVTALTAYSKASARKGFFSLLTFLHAFAMHVFIPATDLAVCVEISFFVMALKDKFTKVRSGFSESHSTMS